MRIGSAPRRNALFAIRAVPAGTSGHGLGCIDMTGSLRPRTRGRRPPSDPAATSPTPRPGQFANRVDHRGKHQAPGWTHTLTPDGTLTVTTPSGLTALTKPPPY